MAYLDDSGVTKLTSYLKSKIGDVIVGKLKGTFSSIITPTQDYDWDTSNPPSTDQYYTGLKILDSQGMRTANVDTHANADGKRPLYLEDCGCDRRPLQRPLPGISPPHHEKHPKEIKTLCLRSGQSVCCFISRADRAVLLC